MQMRFILQKSEISGEFLTLLLVVSPFTPSENHNLHITYIMNSGQNETKIPLSPSIQSIMTLVSQYWCQTNNKEPNLLPLSLPTAVPIVIPPDKVEKHSEYPSAKQNEEENALSLKITSQPQIYQIANYNIYPTLTVNNHSFVDNFTLSRFIFLYGVRIRNLLKLCCWKPPRTQNLNTGFNHRPLSHCNQKEIVFILLDWS
jgi:hypothetical protein